MRRRRLVQGLGRVQVGEGRGVAREHIERGGDYRRAIDIFNMALLVDPDNPDLKGALANAEEDRWMTPERFSRAKKGMTTDEVRELLGQPNLRNIRDYPDKEVTAWFYPTSEAGDAAAIWFRTNASGDLVVYQTSSRPSSRKILGASGIAKGRAALQVAR